MQFRLFVVGLSALLFQCAVSSKPRYCDIQPPSRSVGEKTEPARKHSEPSSDDWNKFRKKQWELYHIVKNLIHTPYQWGGEQPKYGMDCSGLTFYAYKEKMGYPLNRTAKGQYDQCKEVSIQDIRFGDLIFFSQNPHSTKVNHVGIYVNNRKFLHASLSSGVTVTALDTPYWKNRILGARRILQTPEAN